MPRLLNLSHMRDHDQIVPEPLLTLLPLLEPSSQPFQPCKRRDLPLNQFGLLLRLVLPTLNLEDLVQVCLVLCFALVVEQGVGAELGGVGYLVAEDH